MRLVLVPVLALIAALPTFASDRNFGWEHRSPRKSQPEMRQSCPPPAANRHRYRPHHRKVALPPPPVVRPHPRPLPPPLPVGIHIWFGL